MFEAGDVGFEVVERLGAALDESGDDQCVEVGDGEVVDRPEHIPVIDIAELVADEVGRLLPDVPGAVAHSCAPSAVARTVDRCSAVRSPYVLASGTRTCARGSGAAPRGGRLPVARGALR